MLCRAHGCDMCSTEMIDAAGYARSERYRAQYPFIAGDRPLVVQLGGSNPEDLATAATYAAPHCDGVELNVGCPQRCARKGGYGAFLMDKSDLLRRCVQAMAKAIKEANPLCACCVKIRCFEDAHATLALAQMLQDAGCQCLTVHGRTRDGGGGKRTGKWPANWDWIRHVKQHLAIPVVSNGNIRAYQDIRECLAFTGADCVMTGCGALKRPFIFSPTQTLDPRASSWLSKRSCLATPALHIADEGDASTTEAVGGGVGCARTGGQEASPAPQEKHASRLHGTESLAPCDTVAQQRPECLAPQTGGGSGVRPADNQWEGRLKSSLLYLEIAAVYGAHPRQITKHLQEMLPKAVLRRPSAAVLLRLINALAVSTSNQPGPSDIQALQAQLQSVLLDLVHCSNSLADASRLSDSDDD